MTKAVTILLVEDDKVDVLAIRRSFRDPKIANPIVEAHDGIEALEHLHGENGREKISSPCLILLDLHMPRMGGIEFLEVLHDDPLLRRSRVFIMTTSAADEDRIQAYDHNVAGYVVKGRIRESFLEAISMLQLYWRVIDFPD